MRAAGQGENGAAPPRPHRGRDAPSAARNLSCCCGVGRCLDRLAQPCRRTAGTRRMAGTPSDLIGSAPHKADAGTQKRGMAAPFGSFKRGLQNAQAHGRVSARALFALACRRGPSCSAQRPCSARPAAGRQCSTVSTAKAAAGQIQFIKTEAGLRGPLSPLLQTFARNRFSCAAKSCRFRWPFRAAFSGCAPPGATPAPATRRARGPPAPACGL